MGGGVPISNTYKCGNKCGVIIEQLDDAYKAQHEFAGKAAALEADAQRSKVYAHTGTHTHRHPQRVREGICLVRMKCMSLVIDETRSDWARRQRR